MTPAARAEGGPSDWSGRSVLVTGATGFVGSWLAKRLLEMGAQVVALVLDADPRSELVRSGDIQRVATVSGALEDLAAVERAVNAHEVDTVFHLGAQTVVGVAHRSPLATLEANVRGTYHVLEACRRHRGTVLRVVIASSDKAYGAGATPPYDEATPLAGRHPYEVSKSCADLVAQCYAHTYGLPVAIARCGNIYGGGDLNWSRIVPGTIRSLLRGERPVVRSDGTFLRDYVHVSDAVDAYLRLAACLDHEGVAGQAFNFSGERPVSVLALVDLLRHHTGREDLEPVVLDRAEGEIRDQFLSSVRARSLLGWEARVDLDEGLPPTVDWYRALLG